MFDQKTIVEDGANGEIQDVLIAPVGQFVGSNSKGEPVHQNFTQQSLEAIATSLNQTGKEILCDADHASAKEGLERNTRAVGWFSKFVANAKGLFGLLKLTKWGRELISNREYRHVSPVFRLNSEAEPTELLSVASTNQPAIDVPENTILNTEPITTQEEVELDMTKEELREFIINTMNEQNKAEVLNQTAEPKDDEPSKSDEPSDKADETSVNDEPKSETDEVKSECDTAKSECDDVKSECDDAKNDEPSASDETSVNDEPKVDEPKVDEETEVIQEEALNQKSTTTVPVTSPEWRNLRGKEFFEWLKKHPDEVRAQC